MTEISIRPFAERSVIAARAMLGLTPRRKRAMLYAIADALESRASEVLAANALDLAAARARGRAHGCLERLEITPARFGALVNAFRTIADLNDPIGEPISRWIRPNGLEIVRVRVPIGVVGVAFESRPHVVPYSAALCFKVGNVVLLVGDNDARATSERLVEAIREGGEPKGLPPDALQAVFSDHPQSYRDLARMQGLVDVLIPRGGRAFVEDIVDYASVPVLKHLGGSCHIYVDAAANLDMATQILHDGRCNEPYACNSADTVLVHREIAGQWIPALAASKFCHRVRLVAAAAAQAFLPPGFAAKPDPEDTDLTLQLAIVADVQEAVDRINRSGSHVADAIISEDEPTCERFLREVDSACVLVNASPRFADGGEFGMGAEIGYATDKLYARGPLGLEELTCTKYLVQGKGQVRG